MARYPNKDLAYAPFQSGINSPNCRPYLISSLVFACVTTAVIAVRFIARYRSKLNVGLDDAFIILALVPSRICPGTG